MTIRRVYDGREYLLDTQRHATLLRRMDEADAAPKGIEPGDLLFVAILFLMLVSAVITHIARDIHDHYRRVDRYHELLRQVDTL